MKLYVLLFLKALVFGVFSSFLCPRYAAISTHYVRLCQIGAIILIMTQLCHIISQLCQLFFLHISDNHIV